MDTACSGGQTLPDGPVGEAWDLAEYEVPLAVHEDSVPGTPDVRHEVLAGSLGLSRGRGPTDLHCDDLADWRGTEGDRQMRVSSPLTGSMVVPAFMGNNSSLGSVEVDQHSELSLQLGADTPPASLVSVEDGSLDAAAGGEAV